MELTAILCNHAEAQNNMLYVSGGGIDRMLLPPGAPAPWAAVIAIGLIVTVPWTQTNQQHSVTVDLIDADDQPVQVPSGPDGETGAFHAELSFNIGRPPTLAVGEEQNVALAVNVPGLPFTSLGRFRFIIKIDGTTMSELLYTVANIPGLTLGTGPSAIPGF